MLTKRFWLELLERSVRAAAGSLVGLWVTGSGLNLFAIDWKSSLGVAGGAAVFSLAVSLLGSQVGDPDTGSLLARRGRHELK